MAKDQDNSSHGWSLLRMALDDERLNRDDFLTLVRMALDIYAPSDAALDASRAHANRTWLDMIIKSRATRSSPMPATREEREQALNWRPPVVKATADEILRAHAIARGEIEELPTDPLARSIILASMKARNETPPRGRL